MRGVSLFITQIRKCTSSEDENRAINEELGKIRTNLKLPTIDGYNKKKNICKLLFIFLLGRDIDFGHSEALGLLASNVYSEKQTGYLFISLLFNTRSDLTNLLIRCIKSDLESDNMIHINIALQCVSTIANEEMAASFTPRVFQLIENDFIPARVRQTAVLCLLKLYRISEQTISSNDDFTRVVQLLFNANLGIVLCATSLVDLIARRGSLKDTSSVVRIVVTEIWRILCSSRPGLEDYKYHSMPAPWLLINLLRILQNFPPPEEPSVNKLLGDALKNLLDRADERAIENKSAKDLRFIHANYAVFFEAVGVVIKNHPRQDLWIRAVNTAGRLLSEKSPNITYLGLEIMTKLAGAQLCREAMEAHHTRILFCLGEQYDLSTQRRAVDFLSMFCDQSNVNQVVRELLNYVRTADYSVRDAVANKIVGVAQHHLPDYSKYIAVLLELVSVVQGSVDEKLGFRIIELVLAHEDAQHHAVKTVFDFMKSSYPLERLVRVGGFILGEFGHLIASQEYSSAAAQWQLLRSNYARCDNYTKAILLSSLMKIVHKFPEVRQLAYQFFRHEASSADAELQQRAVEYLQCLGLSYDVRSAVFPTGSPQKRLISEKAQSETPFPLVLCDLST